MSYISKKAQEARGEKSVGQEAGASSVSEVKAVSEKTEPETYIQKKARQARESVPQTAAAPAISVPAVSENISSSQPSAAYKDVIASLSDYDEDAINKAAQKYVYEQAAQELLKRKQPATVSSGAAYESLQKGLSDFDEDAVNAAAIDYQVALAREKKEQEAAAREAEINERLSGYSDLSKERDYRVMSQYQSTYMPGSEVRDTLGNYSNTGYDDLLYDYINRDPHALQVGGLASGEARGSEVEAQLIGKDKGFLRQMSERQIADFNYLYATRGKDAAYQYVLDISSDLNKKDREKTEKWFEDYAGEHPGIASLSSVATKPLSAGSFVGQALDYLDDGVIDQNAAYNRFSYANTAIRDTVSKKIEDKWGPVGSYAYQIGMSMADSVVNMLPVLATGGSSAAIERLMLGIMGSGAAADTVISMKDKGYDDDRVMALGTIAGIAEYLTERIGMDALMEVAFRKAPEATLKQIIAKGLAEETLAEGAEEGLSDLINWSADAIYAALTGDPSEFEEMVRAYKAEGKTDGEAMSLAVADRWKELGLDVLGGSISGLLMGGSFAGFNIGNDILSRVQSIREAEGGQQALVDQGLESAAGSRANALAQESQQVLDSGRDLSIRRTLAQMKTNNKAIESEAFSDAVWKSVADDLQTPAEPSQRPSDAFYGSKGINTQTGTENGLKSKTGGSDSNAGAKAEIPGYNITNDEIAEKKAKAIPVLQSMGETLGQSGSKNIIAQYDGRMDAIDYAKEYVRVYNAAKRGAFLSSGKLTSAQNFAAQSAGRNDAGLTGEYKEAENGGTKVHIRQGGERAGSADSGGQISEVAEKAGREAGSDVQRREAYSRPRDGETATLSYGEKVSTASQGIAGGSDSDGIRILNQDSDSKLTKLARDYARRHGVRAVLFGGSYMTVDGHDTVRGLKTGDRVFVRADDPDFDAYQLMRHEVGHVLIVRGEIDLVDVRERLDKNFSPEQRRIIAEMYIEAYDGAITTAEQAFEEMVCDALGDMNIFFDRGQVISAINERLMDELKKAAKESMKSNRIRAPAGGNEIKFSTKGEVLSLKGVDWMGDYSSIKDQLQKHAEEINTMDPVAIVDYVHNYKESLVDIMLNELPSIGGKVIKNSGVTFEFENEGAGSISSHAHGADERAAAIASPYIAKYGKLIAGQKNHEGTGLTTLTFAAPVIINGTTANVGLAVQFQFNGRPRAVNVGLQSGGPLKIDNKKASRGISSRVTRYEQGTSLPTRDASGNNIPSVDEPVKVEDIEKRFSISRADAAPAVEAINGFDGIQMEMDLAGLLKKNEIKTVFDAFKRELIYDGGIDFVGRTFKNANELAVAANVFRDPRFETFRYFFVDGEGKVVLNTGVTSKIPNTSPLAAGKDDKARGKYLSDLFNAALSKGATTLYLLHNHPSGNPTPSKADFAATGWLKEYAEQGPISIGGSVVIDHNLYALYDESGRYTLYDHNDYKKEAVDPLLAPGKTINGPSDLLAVARTVNAEKDDITFIFLNAKLKVTGIQKVPGEYFRKDGSMDPLRNYLHDNGLLFGASEIVAYANEPSAFTKTQLTYAFRDGLLWDAVSGGDTTLRAQGLSRRTSSDNGYMGKPHAAETRFSMRASAISMDQAYLDAVSKGDMETAQQMVNEAAARSGYVADSEYQGTSAFNGKAPSSNAYYDTKEERLQAWEDGEFEGDQSLADFKDGIDISDLDFFLNDPRAYRNADSMHKEAIQILKAGISSKDGMVTMYRSVPKGVKENRFRNGDWITPSKAYAKDNARVHSSYPGWEDGYRIIEQAVPVENIWWDGNDIAEWGYDDGRDYGYQNTQNNAKLLDPVTYDDEGNVIPLSKRFNEKSPDIRFSMRGNGNNITAADVHTVRSIGPKSINAFTSDDIKKSEKWAKMYFKDLDTKSPFFNAWFGNWRAYSVHPVSVADIPAYEDSKEFRKGLRGTFKNNDTEWDIRVSREGIGNTIAHSGSGRLSEFGLSGIKELVENAVLLDSEVHEHHSNNATNDAIAFDHKLYAIGRDINSAISLYKLTIEDTFQDVKHPSDKRFHNLKQIKKIAEVSTDALAGKTGSDGSAASSSTIKYTVADLYEFVKAYDKDFTSAPTVNVAMLNEDGTPKILYHGTDADFTVFDRTKGRSTMDIQGSFFSPWEIDAEGYGSNVKAYYLNLRNPAPESVAYRALNRFKGQNNAGIRAREYLESLGYDGVNNNDEEYIAFYPEQIKSATDNIGTFDGENPDVRFSQKNAESEDVRKLKAENRLLKQKYEAAKKVIAELRQKLDETVDQMKRGRRPGVRRADVEKLARDTVKTMQSRADVKWVASQLKEIGDFMVQSDNLSFDELKTMLYPVAKNIAENTFELMNGSELETIDQIRNYFKGQKFYFDNMAQFNKNRSNIGKAMAQGTTRGEIADYETLRRHNMSRFTFTKDVNARAIDDAWKEAQGMFGRTYFPENINTIPDMVLHISDLLDNLGPVYENPYQGGAMADVIEYISNDLLDALMSDAVRQYDVSLADKMDQELARQKYQYEEKLKAVRQQRDEKIEAVKQYYRDLRHGQAAARKDSQARQRLLNVAKRLNNKKLPAANRALINQYTEDLDLVSVNLTGRTLENLQLLRDWYENEAETNPDFIRDTKTEKDLARLSKKQISELSQEEVASLSEILLNIENELRTASKLIDTQERRDIRMLGGQIIQDIKASKGPLGTGSRHSLDNLFINSTLSPERMVRRLTGYMDNDPMYQAVKALSEGQRTQMEYTRQAEELFKVWTNDKAFMDRIAGKKAKEITISGIGKDGVTTAVITPDMRMALYLHSLNNDSLIHIAGGGITVPDVKLYKKGDMENAYKHGTTIKLKPSQVRDIVAKMPQEEKLYARAVSAYFNNMSQGAINEVSEKLKGYSLAQVENYFPINTNKDFLKKEFDTIKFDGTIEGMGFLKERIQAAGPIYLRDMTSVLNQSIKQTAKYVGLAVPVRNFNKLWGVSSGSFDENGNFQHYTNSVQDTLGDKWGVAASDYMENLMADVNGSSGRPDPWGEWFSRLRSGYAGAVLTLNASVAMKQAASYPTAGAVLGFKPLAKALAHPGKVDIDLINKYTPLFWYRSQGFSTQELGDIAKRNRQIPKALNWVQGMDIATTKTLWKASEYYVQENSPKLKQGADAYYKAVAQIYNRVIEETQPNYTVMQRPDMLRSKNQLLNSLSMFKTQPFQNFNVLYDAYANMDAKRDQLKLLNTDEAKAAYEASKKNAWNATWSQILQLAVFAGMTAAWQLFRGRRKDYENDEGELSMTSVLKKIGKDMIGSEASTIPFGSEIWQAISSLVFGEKYYGFDSVGASSVNDLVNAGSKTVNAVKGMFEDLSEGKDVDPWEYALKLDDVADTACKVLGIPYENVVNLFNAVFMHSARAVAGKYRGTYQYLKLTTPKSSTASYYDNLYDAYRNDKSAYEEIYYDMLDHGFEEDKIKNAMESRMKKAQGVEKVSELDARYLAPAEERNYEKLHKELAGSDLWHDASAQQRKKVEDKLYDLSAGTATGLKYKDKIAGGSDVGLTQTEWLLYQLALDMVDEPNSSGKLGTYTASEKDAAADLIDLDAAIEEYLRGL